eukprot:c3491_g1_i1.p1 GENE.c3491_g1_i1~~c3491_g1_i1.p1  ORF type:complete len:319 (+),score=73.04 c3491_g1_i1:75-959(+)
MTSFIEDDEGLNPNCMFYFENRVWMNETKAKRIVDMTANEIADIVEEFATQSSNGAVILKLAKVIKCENMDGKLLMAAGSEYLCDYAMGIVGKRDRHSLIVICNSIIAYLKSRDEVSGAYWDRLLNGTNEEVRLCKQFEKTVVGEHLKLALIPQPLSTLRYCILDWMTDLSVQVANDHVEKFSHDPAEQFKIVSVSTESDPMVIRFNLIYTKGATGSWTVLASVDFAQHGSAPPGHWHLNRNTHSQIIEHHAIQGDVWHGSPDTCPIWWLLIPQGRKYHLIPERVRRLMKLDID